MKTTVIGTHRAVTVALLQSSACHLVSKQARRQPIVLTEKDK